MEQLAPESLRAALLSSACCGKGAEVVFPALPSVQNLSANPSIDTVVFCCCSVAWSCPTL